jgi:diguanylate cyclase (GGDEF)-like protein
MSEKRNDEKFLQALENCAREPVHIPGSIQPNGYLLCFDTGIACIHQVSANVGDFFGIGTEEVLAASPEALLGKDAVRNIRSALQLHGDTTITLTIRYTRADDSCDLHVTLYRSDTVIVIELERDSQQETIALLSEMNTWLAKIAAARSVPELLEILVEAARELAGFDRTMVYAFDQDWNGTVMAESRTPEAASFLEHRFPATDIPAQVRSLYLQNPLRCIFEAGSESVSLVPECNPLTDKPLDMTHGVLRAVSPVHARYLQNMGVTASMSVAIRSERGLWGLLACHGFKPLDISPSQRDALRVMTETVANRLFLLEAVAEKAYLQRVRDSRALLSEVRGSLQEAAALVEKHGRDWLDLFGACGIALLHQSSSAGVETFPDDKSLLKLREWLAERVPRSGIWFSDAVHAEPRFPEHVLPAGCCGLLAVRLMVEDSEPGWLLLFRDEWPVTHLWAGKGNDTVEHIDGSIILTPRNSFEAWREEVRGHSLPWEEVQCMAAIDLAEDLEVLLAAQEIEKLNASLKRERMQLEKANRKLERIAQTDALTHVWNRRRMEEAIDAHIAMAERAQQEFALLLFDVDHFKRVNDELGHEVGDDVLVQIADIINRELRGGDNLARWGGEEFVVLASDTSAETGRILAERLRRQVEAADFGPAGKVTISLGVAAWRHGDKRNVLVRRADEAMYAAKGCGRNSVMSAN